MAREYNAKRKEGEETKDQLPDVKEQQTSDEKEWEQVCNEIDIGLKWLLCIKGTFRDHRVTGAPNVHQIRDCYMFTSVMYVLT